MKECLMGLASGMALLAWGVVLAVALYPLLKRSAGRLREAGRGKCVRSALALLAVGLCVAYGGSKPVKPDPEPTPALHTISYDLAGGENDPDNPASYREGGVSIELKDPVRAGYVFAGWEPAGVIPAGATSDFHFTALWRAETPTDPVVDPEDPVVGPEDPTPGPSDPVVGPEDPPSGPSDPVVDPVDPVDPVPSLRLWETVLADGTGGYVTTGGHELPFAATASATFDGVVLDAGNRAAGTIQVKASKASATRGSKLKAKVEMLGRKAVSFSGTLAKDGVATLTTRKADDGELVLTLGANGLNGTWGAYTVVGARNLFAAREAAAAAALGRWQGVYSVALGTETAAGPGAAFAAGWSVMSLSVGAKGRVKVSGAMADGAKVSLSGQLLVGDAFCMVPVVAPLYSKKGGVGFCVVLEAGKEPVVAATSDWNAELSRTPFTATLGADAPVARLGGALPSELTVSLPVPPAEIAGAPVFAQALPQGMSVAQAGGRFTLPRATKVVLSDGVLAGAEDANPSGLKLTYAAKTGLVKGSFTVYAQAAGKLKKFKATVAGGLVGSAGYGTLTVKGAGSWPFLLK